jgi:Tfp pilus assembly protein PilO
MKNAKIPDLSHFRPFLFPVVVVVLMTLSGVLILKPKMTAFLDLRKDLAEQKKELAILSQKVAVLEGYDQNELQNRADFTLKVLPAEKNAPLVLATVRSLISEHSLTLSDLTIGVGSLSTESAKVKTKAEEKEGIPSFSISLSFSGALSDLYRFLTAIESTLPLMRIEELSFSREGQTIEADLDLVSFYLVLPQSLGKTDRQIEPLTSEEEKVYLEINQYSSPKGSVSFPYVTSGKENPFTY